MLFKMSSESTDIQCKVKQLAFRRTVRFLQGNSPSYCTELQNLPKQGTGLHIHAMLPWYKPYGILAKSIQD